MKKLKGKNPVPWIDGTILDLIKKKETMRRKLKKYPNNSKFQNNFKLLRSQVKQQLLESRDKFLNSLESDCKKNTKRFWSVLKQNSKTNKLPSRVSMATNISSPTSSQDSTITADTPNDIADLHSTNTSHQSSPQIPQTIMMTQ